MAKWQLPDDVSGSSYWAQNAPLKKGEMILYLAPEGPLMVGRSPDGLWRCLAWLSLTDRQEIVIFRLEVRPWGDDVLSLGTNPLRDLPLHRWLTQAHSRLTDGIAEWLADEGGVPTHSMDAKELRRLRRVAKDMAESTTPRPGPKGFGENFYRRLALDYLELQGKGVSRGIRWVLAEQENRRQKRDDIDDRTVRDWLTKATRLGFLSAGSPGRAGRRPGPNLYEDSTTRKEGSTDGKS
ncbi:MAG: hypothetical protein ABSA65_11785 [Acidimicrobiales bacterium]